MVLPLAEFFHADFVGFASEHPPIAVPSSASSRVSGGRMVGSRLASIDLPVPGGPINSMLYAVIHSISAASHRDPSS